MEAMLGISLYSYLYLFNKIGAEGRMGSAWKRGRWGGKGGQQGEEMAQTMYIHMNKHINNFLKKEKDNQGLAE
jgi:hypothetical protein